MTKRRVEKRIYPWRAALTSVACVGPTDDPHLALTYAELEQTDPMGAPYEYVCPRCERVGPSGWWDPKVPVPAHEFIGGFQGMEVRCRICTYPEDNRAWHPEPAKNLFDHTKVALLTPVMAIGSLEFCLDDGLGYMELFVAEVAAQPPAEATFDPATGAYEMPDGRPVWSYPYTPPKMQRIVMSEYTWRTLNAHEEAFERLLDDRTLWDELSHGGTRLLNGIPVFDAAVRAFRQSRGEDVVKARDEITQIAEELASLVTQAAGVGHGASDDQRKILMGRYMGARERFDVLQQRMEALASQLDMAALSVMSFG